MRRAPRRSVARLVAASWLVATWGCGDGSESVSTSRTEAKVAGKVTIMGKPATRGRVLFSAANSRRKDVAPRSAEIGKDGSYEIMTLIGGNSVSVDGTGNPAAGTYNSRNIEVQSGTNTLDLDLPLKR